MHHAHYSRFKWIYIYTPKLVRFLVCGGPVVTIPRYCFCFCCCCLLHQPNPSSCTRDFILVARAAYIKLIKVCTGLRSGWLGAFILLSFPLSLFFSLYSSYTRPRAPFFLFFFIFSHSHSQFFFFLSDYYLGITKDIY